MMEVDVQSMLDAADIGISDDARLAALKTLLETTCSRPVPAPRWKVLSKSINAELRRRSEIEGRSESAIFESEITAAIALAAPIAQAVAARAFVETYQQDLRRRVADFVLEALLGDWRHPADSNEIEGDTQEPDALDVAHAQHLIERLADVAELTATELAAVEAQFRNEPMDATSRKALSRARERVRTTIPPYER